MPSTHARCSASTRRARTCCGRRRRTRAPAQVWRRLLRRQAAASQASGSVVPSAGGRPALGQVALDHGIDALSLSTASTTTRRCCSSRSRSSRPASTRSRRSRSTTSRSEQYERAVKHLTVALALDEKSHVLFSNRCTAYIALEQYDKAMEDADERAAAAVVGEGLPAARLRLLPHGAAGASEVVLKEGLELDPATTPSRRSSRR